MFARYYYYPFHLLFRWIVFDRFTVLPFDHAHSIISIVSVDKMSRIVLKKSPFRLQKRTRLMAPQFLIKVKNNGIVVFFSLLSCKTHAWDCIFAIVKGKKIV